MNNKKSGKFVNFMVTMDIKRLSQILLSTIAVVGLILGLNFSFRFLTEKFDSKVDMSVNNMCSLLPDFKRYLKGYGKKLKFYVIEPSYKYYSSEEQEIGNEILKSVVAANPKFSLHHVSALDFQDANSKFSKIKILNSDKRASTSEHYGYGARCLIVDESDSNNLKGYFVKPSDYVRAYASYDDIVKLREKSVSGDKQPLGYWINKVSVTQRPFVVALNKLAENSFIKIAATTGHKEFDYSLNSGFFDGIGVNISTIDLKKDDISPEQDAVLIAAPAVDFDQEEINKIQNYLNSGGKLIYCASAAVQPENMAVLDGFLNKLGFVFSEGCVFDPDNGGFDPAVMVDWKNQKNAVVDKMVERNLPACFDLCKPLKLQDAQDGWQVCEIGKVEPKYVHVHKGIKNFDEISKLPKSEFVVAATSQKKVESDKTAKVFVLASSHFNKGLFSNGTADSAQKHGFMQGRSSMADDLALSNVDFMRCVIQDLTGKTGYPYIPMKFFKVPVALNAIVESSCAKKAKDRRDVFASSRRVSEMTALIIGVFLLVVTVVFWFIKKQLRK